MRPEIAILVEEAQNRAEALLGPSGLSPRPTIRHERLPAPRRCLQGWRHGALSSSENAGEPPVRLTIGVHYGEVFAGVVGDERRLEYTILGDVVNSAQRLQERARELGFALIASAASVQAADADAHPSWRPLPPQPLRGRCHPMPVLGRHPQSLA